MERSQTLQMTLEVMNQEQADAVSAAWREIITNKAHPRLTQPAEDLDEVKERGRTALQTIEEAIRQNPTTGRKLPRQGDSSELEFLAVIAYSIGVRSPSESWGRSSLYSSIHQ